MSFVSINTKKLLAISQLKGVGEKSLSSLANLEHFDDMSISDITEKSLNKKYSANEIDSAVSFAEDQIHKSDTQKHRIISFFDKEYPHSLRLIETPSPILFCAGNLEALNEKCITVIGTREPTGHGEIIAKNLTKWFSENGWNIVSGLAIGVDSLAHQACIDVQGKTIAVLAHGLETIYPKSNRKLAEDILAQNGTLVSEYHYDSFIARSNFVKRDAVQAALASAVFLVQSGVPGGSLHASKAALDLNRPLIVVGQSKTDLINNESKCKANILLSGNNLNEIKKALKINSFDKNLIIAMPNKSYYKKVDDVLQNYLFTVKETPAEGFGF
ncbi:Rossmann fold nucleotide-binding protein [Rahnella aquatilis CIP 78.65 = ATCC 33071]|uniref:Putative Rossmann fold nucleotide-binding protein involved in DNA uptake n=1 Tax=Rahnella aquatilis (strain ATCC 33071 / DSM 4594 / JCM 1683 / NBRC 105701 / NCIMB 13365 / CIP 78.65) TaxID=745277 RepID=H2IRH1_RAHAC|nr:DNA-processing protein DprA [Rahnella aquatilis]AEX51407.1 putative Rossmann fold nucleotide-binding protein involved in DNA uptake [Rahnella aquatilis CIP 78.65 = ATCC 33071]KFD17294.1 Rossmann fold nucleotide-binding protein [Rahnella aquatilis CIP 78.65 = ATCC 33071]